MNISKKTNRMDETIVFCEDIDHAERKEVIIEELLGQGVFLEELQ